MQRKIKRITTGDLQRELMRFFPQLTEDMVRRDAEKNVLPTYPRFGQQSWYYIQPHALPQYLRQKGLDDTIRMEVLQRLGCNFHQLGFALAS